MTACEVAVTRSDFLLTPLAWRYRSYKKATTSSGASSWSGTQQPASGLAQLARRSLKTEECKLSRSWWTLSSTPETCRHCSCTRAKAFRKARQKLLPELARFDGLFLKNLAGIQALICFRRLLCPIPTGHIKRERRGQQADQRCCSCEGETCNY